MEAFIVGHSTVSTSCFETIVISCSTCLPLLFYCCIMLLLLLLLNDVVHNNKSEEWGLEYNEFSVDQLLLKL